jgi:hypothetical protein
MERIYALVNGEEIINVVYGGSPEWFAEHEDYKVYDLIDVTDMSEKPSPSGWTYKDGEFVKDPMPEPLPPVAAEDSEPVAEFVEQPGLNPAV